MLRFSLDKDVEPEKAKKTYLWVQECPLMLLEYRELHKLCDWVVDSTVPIEEMKRRARETGINPIARGLVVATSKD